jgi:hypothetical protein
VVNVGCERHAAHLQRHERDSLVLGKDGIFWLQILRNCCAGAIDLNSLSQQLRLFGIPGCKSSSTDPATDKLAIAVGVFVGALSIRLSAAVGLFVIPVMPGGGVLLITGVILVFGVPARGGGAQARGWGWGRIIARDQHPAYTVDGRPVLNKGGDLAPLSPGATRASKCLGYFLPTYCCTLPPPPYTHAIV